MNTNILRQVTDIQVQADRLISRAHNFEEIEDFQKYSVELKSFLLNNIDDDFIKKYVLEIPDLHLDEQSNSPGFLNIVLAFFGGTVGSYYGEKRKIDEALDTIREIRNKYASAEFMIKNYFN